MSNETRDIVDVKIINLETGEEIMAIDCTKLTVNYKDEKHSFGHSEPIITALWKREVIIEMKDISVNSPELLHQMAVKFLVLEYLNKRITVNELEDKCGALRKIFDGFKKEKINNSTQTT